MAYGSPVLPIHCTAVWSGDTAEPLVCIQVRDTGPGIPPAEAPLLFGKFVRLQRDLSGSIRGTGLGLYITKQLVEAMGGHIWLESSGIEGEGSLFAFTLKQAGTPHVAEYAVEGART